MIRPKFILSRREQLIKLMPIEFQRSDAYDPIGRKRFGEFAAELSKLSSYRLVWKPAPPSKGSKPTLTRLQIHINIADLASIEKILSEGNLQFDTGIAENIAPKRLNYRSQLMDLQLACYEWLGTESQTSSPSEIDHKERFSLLLNNRLSGLTNRPSGGLMFQSRDVYRAIAHQACDPRYPVSNCRRWLQELPQQDSGRRVLISLWRQEFHDILLPAILDPVAWKLSHTKARDFDWPPVVPDNLYGTFDSESFTRSFAVVANSLLKNTQRTYIDFDKEGTKVTMKAAQHIPPPLNLDSRFWPLRSYIQSMRDAVFAQRWPNFIENSMLVRFNFSVLNDPTMAISSQTWDDLARIALAVRIYRAEHQGQFPKSKELLLPNLKVWPNDQFDGQPIRFDSSKQVAYSVGSSRNHVETREALKWGYAIDLHIVGQPK